MSGQTLINNARRAGGFLTDRQVAVIAADPDTRLTLVLVRCGGGRFMCPAQDAKHFIDIIDFARRCEHETGEDAATDYVRDISLPVSGIAVLSDLMTALRSVRLALPVVAMAAFEKAEEELRV